MHPNTIIDELHKNHSVFQKLLEGTSQEHYRFKPDSSTWCLLEVLCHLLDEEREDFRARVKHVLEHPELPLQSISPKTWPVERDYLNQNFDTVLHDFLFERQQSVAWLRSLKEPNWNLSITNDALGTMTAHSFLTNWLAHDYLHIRQINRIKYEYLNAKGSADLGYAGNW